MFKDVGSHIRSHGYLYVRLGRPLLGLAVVLCASSCSKTPTTPHGHISSPETELTYAPVESDTTTYRVHLYWNGFDDDGEVVRFRYAVDEDSVLPRTQWKTTTAKDTILVFSVDPILAVKGHVFQVAAEDNDGRIDPTPASRFFSAKTIPPSSRIERGPAAFNPIVGPNFAFGWSGSDPDGGNAGGPAPVDSFQYLLLRVGAIADSAAASAHDPLPPFSQSDYTAMIRAAVGDGLPALWTSPDGVARRLDDWRWIGTRALERKFQNMTPGEYVFAVRAVDVAGAREKDLAFVRNIRRFTVVSGASGRVFAPALYVCSSARNRCSYASGSGNVGFFEILEGETVSFSWSASADAYGGTITGYAYALDDTSSFPALDARVTGVTFQPSQLTAGSHFFAVRAVDDLGLVTTLILSITAIHPAFKDPGTPRSILFVDDSDFILGNGSGPNDQVETDWWTLSNAGGSGPLLSLGIPYTEWDTSTHAYGTGDLRQQPGLRDLASYSTVVWVTDQASTSVETGLFRTVAGNNSGELLSYLRAGGTLILTGWSLAQSTSGTINLTYRTSGPAALVGVCAAYPPGTRQFNDTVFPRMFMGIDNSLPSNGGLRSGGNFDFTRAIPTASGVAFGFDTARVDTGNASIGQQYPGTGGPTYKWNTQPFGPTPSDPDQKLFPGIAGIEGWYMAQTFGCQPSQDFGFEDRNAPMAQVIYTYHGADKGVLQDGGPSPREGLAVGTLVQSHDLATNGGTYVPAGSVGRIAFFTFPLYFLQDADAVSIMRRAFEYVNASPTLP